VGRGPELLSGADVEVLKNPEVPLSDAFRGFIGESTGVLTFTLSGFELTLPLREGVLLNLLNLPPWRKGTLETPWSGSFDRGGITEPNFEPTCSLARPVASAVSIPEAWARRGAMKRRSIGRSVLSVAPLAFGGNVFGWTVDEAMAFRLLDTFVDSGFNLIDTADTYSTWVPGHQGGESETILGRWLRARGRRSDVVIATKVGMEMPSGKGLDRSHIRASITASLARLQTDHVDLYQSHVDDLGTPIEETLETYERLIAEGKTRAIGASNFTTERLTAALEASQSHGWPRYECLQPRYNLLDRDAYEGALEATCRSAGLGVITHSSLAKGYLSGKYRSEVDFQKLPHGPAAARRSTGRGRRVVSALELVAKRLEVPMSTVAIAWIVGRPTVTAAIASATTVVQLEELMAGARLELDAASRKELDVASAGSG